MTEAPEGCSRGAALAAIATGMALHTLGAVLTMHALQRLRPPPESAAAPSLLGGLLVAYGLWAYARRKGRHGAWALLGIFGIVGVVIVAFLRPCCESCGSIMRWGRACEACHPPPGCDMP